MTDPAGPHPRNRTRFVSSLYQLQQHIDDGSYLAHTARRDLARLRRSIGGPTQQIQAYEIIFRHDPPTAEQEVWLLVAGLFGVHPQTRPAPDNHDSLGRSLRRLALARGLNQRPQRDAADESSPIDRRFTHLLSIGPDALPHYLRQCLQLLRTENIAVNYYRLADDLVTLFSADEQRRHRTRLRWARDYYATPHNSTTPDNAPRSTA